LQQLAPDPFDATGTCDGRGIPGIEESARRLRFFESVVETVTMILKVLKEIMGESPVENR
jgi:hypothetical protein